VKAFQPNAQLVAHPVGRSTLHRNYHQIQLGKREPLNLAQLLPNLDDYARQYTNPKTVELLLGAKADLERYGVDSCELEEGDLLDQEALQRVQQHLLAKLQESGVSRTTSRKVALWLTGGALAELAKDYLQAVRAATTVAGKAIPALDGQATPARVLPGVSRTRSLAIVPPRRRHREKPYLP
jgi:hypothetical protein